MKKLLLIIVLTVTATFAYGQRSIDVLFDKYAGKDGFVTISISGNLLKLAHCLDGDEDDNDNSLPSNITELRILVQEDDNMEVENFYDKVINSINTDNYEEFMRVKESDQDLRMLVRTEGRKIKEFLLIGGGEDNLFIQIKGEMTYNEAKRFSQKAKKNHGVNIVADLK
jgi:hypothetical protein